jgi:putative addiction module component (TIGR02574 family)
MSNDAEAIFHAAMQLPADEREELVERLFRTLEAHADLGPTPEQAEMIERRISEVRSGKVKTIAGDDAFAEVMRRIEQGKRL